MFRLCFLELASKVNHHLMVCADKEINYSSKRQLVKATNEDSLLFISQLITNKYFHPSFLSFVLNSYLLTRHFSFQDRKLRGLPALDTTTDQQHSFSTMRNTTSLNAVAYHISQCILNDILEVSHQMMVDFFKIRSGL